MEREQADVLEMAAFVAASRSDKFFAHRNPSGL
jgi:hypothetical protein